jgi:hypothetical protein
MKKIAFLMIISFIFSFSLYFLFETFSDPHYTIGEPERYPIIFEFNSKIIVLEGTSQTYQVNATRINDYLESIHSDFYVYNFAGYGYLLETDDFKSISPAIILYGISYRDFYVEKENEDNVLDINNLFTNIILEINNELGNKNPKALTLQIIRKSIGNKEVFPEPIDNIINIASDDVLRTQVYYSDVNFHKITPYNENPNVKKLENIIKMNKDKGIKMIIFHPPFHKYYLDLISDESKENFKDIMDIISNKYDIKIYDLHEKYADLKIWSDLVHVAYNPDSMIFTDDISKIILEEIKK